MDLGLAELYDGVVGGGEGGHLPPVSNEVLHDAWAVWHDHRAVQVGVEFIAENNRLN